MTVNTRAIDLRTVLLSTKSDEQEDESIDWDHAHLGELRRRATSDLLYPEVQELSLELRELLGQVILGPLIRAEISKQVDAVGKRYALGLELVRLDLAGHFVE